MSTTIYVDATQKHHSGEWCHMWTDGSPDDLHAFAESIGLRRDWAQYKPGFVIPVHYDLRPSKRVLAVKAGAVEVSLFAYLKEHRS